MADFLFFCECVIISLTYFFMELSKKYYDNFFRNFGPDVHLDPVRYSEIAKLCRGRVLDIGCGSGHLADFYFGDYTGVDISDVAIRMAKELRRKDALFFVEDVLDSDNKITGEFDTIVLAEFLEHIEHDNDLIVQLLRLSSSDCRWIVSVPNGDRVPDESHLRTFTIPELRAKFSAFGRVKFYNWFGIRARILMTCDIGQKQSNLISLAIMAKNEGLGLENAVLSCIEFVDRVVIGFDNASNDKTFEVAKRYADVVVPYDWPHSFAKCRALVQKAVPSPWVLWLDGHEFVKENPGLDSVLVENVDAVEISMLLENGFKFKFPRLVKQNVEWGGDVHNYPIIKSRAFLTDFVIAHDREHSQAKNAIELRNKQRTQMVREIMRSEMKKNPKSPRPYFYLAQQSFIENRHRDAINLYKKYLKLSKHKGERWLVYYEMAKARIILNQYLRALWNLRDADREIPGRWEVAKCRGALFAIKGRFKEAIKNLVESFNIQTGNFSYYPEARDDAGTWDFIAWCLFRTQMFPEARIAWNRSVELENEKPENERNTKRLEVVKKVLQLEK